MLKKLYVSLEITVDDAGAVIAVEQLRAPVAPSSPRPMDADPPPIPPGGPHNG